MTRSTASDQKSGLMARDMKATGWLTGYGLFMRFPAILLLVLRA
jgi:hypothetical protein